MVLGSASLASVTHTLAFSDCIKWCVRHSATDSNSCPSAPSQVDKLPRLVVAQTANANPLYRAYNKAQGKDDTNESKLAGAKTGG